ncbi:DUF4344 domain-containing metallopeptidase [Candidatus Parcubacteria bacterium]|nr:DUF4344 domain-containing metallopeptidase [Candidatus Parcubacteria bacterium]
MKRIIILLIVFGALVITSLGLVGYTPESKFELSDAKQNEIEKLKNELKELKEGKNTNATPAPKPAPAPVVKEDTEKETTPQPTPPTKTVLLDLGDFKIFYGPTQNAFYEGLNQLVKDSGVFEGIANFLNVILILQKDFPITFQQCGFINAYYTLEGKEIVICTELLENFAQNFSYFTKSESELDRAITDATFFILFHELGHGLLDIYDLTYSGKEEDVADQLSTIALISFGEDGVRAAITGANLFYITSSNIDAGTYPFWDEHSLNQQRYYNILCWVYGSDSQKYNDFVGVYGLPQERAVRCEREYEKMSEFWDVAILPFVKEEVKSLMEE